MKKVRLIKVIDPPDSDPFDGYEFSKPKIGSCYLVVSKNLCRAHRTSPITEFIPGSNNTEFKTATSRFKVIYYGRRGL